MLKRREAGEDVEKHLPVGALPPRKPEPVPVAYDSGPLAVRSSPDPEEVSEVDAEADDGAIVVASTEIDRPSRAYSSSGNSFINSYPNHNTSGEEEDLTNGRGGVFRRVVTPGTGEQPKKGERVTIHYEGYVMGARGTKFDSSRDRKLPFEFKLGDDGVIRGWNIGVAAMQPGEFSVFTVRADYGFGRDGRASNLPEDALLRFEIELLAIRPGPREVHDMTADEKLAHGQSKRAEGTKRLKAGKFQEAVEAFRSANEALVPLRAELLDAGAAAAAADAGRRLDGVTEREGRLSQTRGATRSPSLDEVTQALLSCGLNLSQCFLKLEEWAEAVESCGAVLALDAESAKALYRRGVARIELHSFDEAREDLKRACVLEPSSKDIREAYARAKAAQTAHKRAEREAFGGMFASGAPEAHEDGRLPAEADEKADAWKSKGSPPGKYEAIARRLAEAYDDRGDNPDTVEVI